LIQRGAWRNHFDETEALLVENFFHRARQLLHVVRGPAGHIRRAGRFRQRHQVERGLENAVRIGRADHLGRRGRRCLASGHRIGQVIDADYFEVHVAPRSMNKMIAADGEQIAVTRVDHYLQFGIRQLQSGSERDGSPVRRVERIQPGISGDASRAADPGDHRDLIQVGLRIEQRAGEAVDCRADAASGTPDVRHAIHAQERFYRVVRFHRDLIRNFEGCFVHRAASTMAFRITFGSCTVPPA
jgi:hypothetical protein